MRKNCYNFQPSLKALDTLGVFNVDDNLEKIVDSSANSINIQQQSDDDEDDDDQVEGIWKKGIAEKIKSHLLRVFSDEDYELQAACTADVEEMYFLRNLPLIKKRLAQGGARLAGLLNAIYQPNSPNHHNDDDDDDYKNTAYPGMSKIISRALKMKGDFDSYVNSPQGQNSRPLTEVKKCPSNIPVWDKGCPCDSYPCFPISFAPIVN
jgi:hypothetical protein